MPHSCPKRAALTGAVVSRAQVRRAAAALAAGSFKVVALAPPLLLHQDHFQVVIRQQGGVQAAAPTSRTIQEPGAGLLAGVQLAAQLLRGRCPGALLVATAELLQGPGQEPADCGAEGANRRGTGRGGLDETPTSMRRSVEQSKNKLMA